MKNHMFYLRTLFCLCAVVLLTNTAGSGTLSTSKYYTWGISNDALTIPDGCTITEAVLTMHNINEPSGQLYIHLLDNPQEGFQYDDDSGTSDYFQNHGVVLSGNYENGSFVCRLSDIDDSSSPIRDLFGNPFSVQLADGTTVTYSSALLELIDYAGTGTGFGFGFDAETVTDITLTKITLTLTVASYQQQQAAYTVEFTLSETMLTPLLLANGNFEQGDVNWHKHPGWSIVENADEAFEGSYCARFDGSTSYTGNHAVYQILDLNAGSSYNLSAMVRNNNNKDMRFLLVFIDALGRDIGYFYTTQATAGQYTRTYGSFAVPSDCVVTWLMMYIHNIETGDGTIAYVDNCTLTGIDSQNSLLDNDGFENGDLKWYKHAGWSIVENTAQAYEGSYCAKFDGSLSYSGNHAVYQSISAEGSAEYDLSAMVRSNTAKDMRFLVLFRGASGAYTGQFYTSSVRSTEYTKTSGTFKTPADCTSMAIMMYIHDIQQNDGTIAYVDNCRLEKMVRSSVKNGSFEEGNTGWETHSGWSVVQDSSNAYEGNFCAKFDSNLSYPGNHAIYQHIAVQGNATYYISAMIRNTTGRDTRFLIVFQNADGSDIGYYYTTAVLSDQYTRTSGTFTTPADCSSMWVMMYIHNVAPGDGTIAYVDNCTFGRL